MICVLEESDGGSGVAFATAVVVVVEEKEEEEKEVVVEGGLLQTGFRLCADEEDVVDVNAGEKRASEKMGGGMEDGEMGLNTIRFDG